MIEEHVKVTRFDDQWVWVEASRQSACAACASKSNCSQGVLSDWQKGNMVEIALAKPDHFEPHEGQEVVIGIEEGSLVKASFLLYLIPLLALVGFAMTARSLGLSEGLQALASLIGLGVGFIAVRLISKMSITKEKFEPVLLRAVHPSVNSLIPHA